MRIKLYFIAVLFLLPTLSLSQEANPAEELRTSKEYQDTLSLFKEPQIFPLSNPNSEVYRVFIFPIFTHPLSIRVEKNGNKYFLIAKRFSGEGGYGWGKLQREKKRQLSEKEWRGLLDLINQAGFWRLESKDKKYDPNEKGEVAAICVDGTDWFLEGIGGGKYHAVRRTCPESKSFKAVGWYLLKLSKWETKGYS